MPSVQQLGWWCTPLISAPGRQRQVISESEANLVYKMNFNTAQEYTEKSCLGGG